MAARSFARTIPALGLCLTFGISSVVWAQEAQVKQRSERPGQQQAEQRQGREQAARPHQAQMSEVMDVLLSTWLIGDNNVEVQLSRLAIDRSQNEQVRQFAQQMVQEHQQLIEQLHRAGMDVEAREGQQSQRLRQQEQQASQQRQQGQQQALQQQQQPRQPIAQQRSPQQGQRQAGYRPQANEQQVQRISSTPAMKLLSIHKEMGDQFVTLMRQELQNKQGAEFDRAFMGGQIVAHHHMLATLQAMEGHASPELQKIIDQATIHTQQHLQEARNIAKQLQPGAAATAAQPETRETQRQ